jgi:hypothetical protein
VESSDSFEETEREQMKEHRQDRYSLILELYADTGTAKLPAIVDYLRGVLESGSFKFLVFAHHTAVMDGVSNFLKASLSAQACNKNRATALTT